MCNIELAVCEDRNILFNPYMLDRLSVAFVGCHFKGQANWELTVCNDESRVTLP